MKLTPSQKQVVAKMLRVDQAGELGATWIYKGQLDVLKDPKYRGAIEEMQAQEKLHLQVMDDILVRSRTRPSLLRPFWQMAGYGLGYATALLGPRAAMACTEAVETVIGEHYNECFYLKQSNSRIGQD
jgi:ubiquinone biosynthesis monooxygenase Coq7